MKRYQRGGALVEFALVLPLLLLLTFLTAEFGRALYQYDTLTKSVRDAARYLTFRDGSPDNIVHARNLVVFGNTTGSGNPLVPGLTLANVPDPAWSSTGAYPAVNTVTVSVTGFTFRSLFPRVFGLAFGNITYGPIRATMRSPS
jgi:hypothetical protein